MDIVTKGCIRGHLKNGPVLEVKVTYHLYQYGMKIKVNSVKNDGSQSWIVISRGINKYVEDLAEESGKSVHCEEMVTSSVEARCGRTEGTIESTITFILDDVCANRSMEVERHSCRRLRQ